MPRGLDTRSDVTAHVTDIKARHLDFVARLARRGWLATARRWQSETGDGGGSIRQGLPALVADLSVGLDEAQGDFGAFSGPEPVAQSMPPLSMPDPGRPQG